MKLGLLYDKGQNMLGECQKVGFPLLIMAFEPHSPGLYVLLKCACFVIDFRNPFQIRGFAEAATRLGQANLVPINFKK
jgi:hypothetical protein